MKIAGTLVLAFGLVACAASTGESALVRASDAPSCPVALMVLGAGQDGGRPQLAHPEDPAWADPARRRSAASVAVVDRRGEAARRWLFEATPDLREELQRLDAAFPVDRPIGLDGIFLTHAHIGHYAGLMFLGHESAGAHGVPVYATARMGAYLSDNGPWSQLVRYENIALRSITDGAPVTLADGLAVTPFLVPHRQEFSDVVGFRIDGPERSAVFLPDIDSWEEWDALGVRIEDVIASVDTAYLDGTFYANGEIPGRDMSGFPHPFIIHSMERFAALPASERAKVRFIHVNHTNPANDPGTPERAAVEASGFAVAVEGETLCL